MTRARVILSPRCFALPSQFCTAKLNARTARSKVTGAKDLAHYRIQGDSMQNMIERLNEEVLVCDGAMGTMLIAKGMPDGDCPDYWGIKNHKILFGIHKEYINAGADIIITNTFGANWLKLKRYRLQKKVKQINKAAVDIAKEAAGDNIYVLGDIGPTGEYIRPAGDIEPEEMVSVFTEQAKILEELGVDAVILETFSDMEELKNAILAVKENTKLPVIASMTFQRLSGKGFRTTSGISIPQLVNDSLLAGADIIGANCTVTGIDMADIVSEIRALGTAFIIAQPNAGMPRLEKGKTVYDETPESFGRYAKIILGKGANIIGGCCGTTPAHIRMIKKVIEPRT
jgi:5-methyltetrahydrofolate--homocysteine methyltransferase